MRYLKYMALLGLLFIPVGKANAQVRVGVGIGPVGVGVGVGPAVVGPAPVCAYGYYSYHPYACAPYGYYGPQWFVLMASSSAPGHGSMDTMGIRTGAAVIGTAEASTAIRDTGIAGPFSTEATSSTAEMACRAAVGSMEVTRSVEAAGSMEAEADSTVVAVSMEAAGGR